MEPTLQVLIAAIVSVSGLALIVTKLVDAVRNAFDPADHARLKAVWNILAFVFGVIVVYLFVAGGFEIDVPGFEPNTLGTGLIVGALASGWHEALDRLSPKNTLI